MQLLKRTFNRKNILVIGDVMIDCYYIGQSSRISPEAPVPVLKKEDEYSVLGGAANVAANLVAAGQNVSIMTVIGCDSAGDICITLLKDKDIASDLVLKSNTRKTTMKTRFLGQNHQQMMRLDIEDDSDISTIDEEKLIKLFKENSNRFDLVVISDYLKGVLTEHLLSEIIITANLHEIKVLIDVKDQNMSKYKNAYLIKPNLVELRALTKMRAVTEQEIELATIALRELCNSEYVLTTCGGEGMVLADRNNETKYFSCVSKEVYDVTGAGDTVIAYIAIGVVNVFPMEETIILANYAAGVKVSKRGTATVSLEEVKQYIELDEMETASKKIITKEEFQQIHSLHVEKKVVFTNGCFDILHVGHVRYLRKASMLGDILIIGINSDSSVKGLKGENRPIISQNERMELLEAIEFIDYIIMFDEETPYQLINAVQPDVLVKGGDYMLENVVGKDIVEKKGGSVVIIPLEGGISTTNIVNKIVQTYT